MAVGARISSTNLSGKTATVTFTPYTGSTSGTTVNLGTKTIPFNNITSHPYGDYNLYFEEYDYTYTLTVSGPLTDTQLFVYTDKMIGKNKWGSATFNFNDFTATMIDLGVSTNDYSLNNVLPLQNSGYGYQFSNGNDKIIIFTDSFNNEIGRYTGTTVSYSFDDLDGRWITFNDYTNGVFTYSDGVHVYTYNLDPSRYYVDIQWDYDATISDSSFFIIKWDDGESLDHKLYRFNSDGTQVLLKTWGNSDYLEYNIHAQYNSDFYVIEKFDTDNELYIQTEIFDLSDTLLETISLTGDTYNNRDYGFVGTNRYIHVSYNGADETIAYPINYYNHNTGDLIQTTHDRDSIYRNYSIAHESDFYPNNYGNQNLLISFYSDTNNWNGWGYEVAFCDIMSIFGDETEFNTYTFTYDETKRIVPWFDQQGTDMFRTRISESNVAKLLTITTTTGATIASLSINTGDIESSDYYYMDNRTVYTIFDSAGNYYTSSLYLIGADGTLKDSLDLEFTNQFGDVNSNSRGKIFYYGYQSTTGYTGVYLNDTTTGFTETGYYYQQNYANEYYTSNFRIDSNMVLYNYSDNVARVLRPTSISSEIALPSWDDRRYINVGRDKFMFTYDDGNGYIHVKLYDFNGNLLNTLDTTFTSLNSRDVYKDRFTVRFWDGNHQMYVMYMISDTETPYLILDDHSMYSVPNDYVSWNY